MPTDEREIIDKIHSLDKNLTRFQAHFDSEIGLLRVEHTNLQERIAKVSHSLYGDDGQSMPIRMDRLEQAEASRKNQQKVMWGGVAAALAPYLQKLIALLSAV